MYLVKPLTPAAVARAVGAKEEKPDVALLRNASPAKKKRHRSVSRSAERAKGAPLTRDLLKKVDQNFTINNA
ncbi:MAG: hypothetical protein J6S34_00065 [Clostridia bacterium]|nr:hypothetical protein [Clostridia bacterium]